MGVERQAEWMGVSVRGRATDLDEGRRLVLFCVFLSPLIRVFSLLHKRQTSSCSFTPTTDSLRQTERRPCDRKTKSKTITGQKLLPLLVSLRFPLPLFPLSFYGCCTKPSLQSDSSLSRRFTLDKGTTRRACEGGDGATPTQRDQSQPTTGWGGRVVGRTRSETA